MIAFPNQIKRIAENSNSISNSKLKSKIESQENSISAIESNSNSKIQFAKFNSLDDVFVPIANGRDITATRDPQGIHLVITDGVTPEPIEDGLLEGLKRSGGTMTELTARYASLLIAVEPASGRRPECFSVRWVEHRLPNSDAGPRSWFLVTDDRRFWESMVFRVGFQWRARMVEPISCLVSPNEVREHGYENDEF